ncbi:hypothetical protein EDD37DRAFT_653999 [Exophiala viscosa]|uniref:uncharacterized protein n=1 Tax=Exophiala viscosa TaxID=2486360 RepID=UPI002198B7B9|nr:hypothetical protein EDD37DRAFT_653999 [Exophiala viscosa]
MATIASTPMSARSEGNRITASSASRATNFLLLSYEVRQAIYQAVFVQDHPISLQSFNGHLVSRYPEDINLAALLLCREVSHEALQVLYTQNYFILHWGSLCYGPPLNQTFSEWLKYLEIDCSARSTGFNSEKQQKEAKEQELKALQDQQNTLKEQAKDYPALARKEHVTISFPQQQITEEMHGQLDDHSLHN